MPSYSELTLNSELVRRGLLIGDALTTINGVSVLNMPFDAILDKMKDAVNKTVMVSVLRRTTTTGVTADGLPPIYYKQSLPSETHTRPLYLPASPGYRPSPSYNAIDADVPPPPSTQPLRVYRKR